MLTDVAELENLDTARLDAAERAGKLLTIHGGGL